MWAVVKFVLSILLFTNGFSLKHESINNIPGRCNLQSQNARKPTSLVQKMKMVGKTMMGGQSEGTISLLQSEPGITGPAKGYVTTASASKESVQSVQNQMPSFLPSGAMDPMAFDPVEKVLEALDVPLNAGSASWPLDRTDSVTKPSPDDASTQMSPGIEPRSQASSTTEGPMLEMKRAHAFPLKDSTLVTLAPAPEVIKEMVEMVEMVEMGPRERMVDPMSFLEQLPLRHQRKAWLSQWNEWKPTSLRWFVPSIGLSTCLCILILLAVLVFAATPAYFKMVPEDEGLSGVKLMKDEDSDKTIQVEVLGKLPSEKLLLRRLCDNKLVVAPKDIDLHSVPHRPAVITFSQHARYVPSFQDGFGWTDIVDALLWRLKHIRDIFSRKAPKKLPDVHTPVHEHQGKHAQEHVLRAYHELEEEHFREDIKHELEVKDVKGAVITTVEHAVEVIENKIDEVKEEADEDLHIVEEDVEELEEFVKDEAKDAAAGITRGLKKLLR